ncbi:MAG: exodeoxyribonuclease III [Rhodobacteraceae bacterium]|nr:exodeoxyribonuclease III [Paracoccaceae bacterium]
MKIATFNINGIRARLPRLIDWLVESRPDVALLQEIKCIDAAFPASGIEDLGYTVVTHGQKSFNGVAILSKYPLVDITRGLAGDEADTQARWLEAVLDAPAPIHLCCLYLPNGNPVDSEKFPYKLAWMDRMGNRLVDLLRMETPAVVAGDFNVIPHGRDAALPEKWRGDALFHPETLARWRRMVNLGFTDAFRVMTPTPGHYTFWDYQGGGWQRDEGIRIDHILLSPQGADLLSDCRIDRDIRGLEKPSDHVPIWVELDC